MHAPLWLRSTGKVPMYLWFIQKLKSCLGDDVTSHSIHSGRATTLTLAGTPDDHIQACGCWSSHAYHIYICKHPIMLQLLLHGCSAFDTLLRATLPSQNHHSHPSTIHYYEFYSHHSLICLMGASAPSRATPSLSDSATRPQPPIEARRFVQQNWVRGEAELIYLFGILSHFAFLSWRVR